MRPSAWLAGAGTVRRKLLEVQPSGSSTAFFTASAKGSPLSFSRAWPTTVIPALEYFVRSPGA